MLTAATTSTSTSSTAANTITSESATGALRERFETFNPTFYLCSSVVIVARLITANLNYKTFISLFALTIG